MAGCNKQPSSFTSVTRQWSSTSVLQPPSAVCWQMAPRTSGYSECRQVWPPHEFLCIMTKSSPQFAFIFYQHIVNADTLPSMPGWILLWVLKIFFNEAVWDYKTSCVCQSILYFKSVEICGVWGYFKKMRVKVKFVRDGLSSYSRQFQVIVHLSSQDKSLGSQVIDVSQQSSLHFSK